MLIKNMIEYCTGDKVGLIGTNGAVVGEIEQAVGFRRFELIDGIMCLNGKRLVFKGVNRHDFSSICGRVPVRIS